ncbi:MAG: DUF444 family protein [Alicyclobacillus sp.]|nr:DUF444 family protein [Alicyclobacillus sp.]
MEPTGGGRMALDRVEESLDWSLFLKPQQDARRYREQLRTYISETLPELVGQLGDGDETVLVPPQADPRIRYLTVPIRMFEGEGASGLSDIPVRGTGDGDTPLLFGHALTVDDIADVLLQQLRLPGLRTQRAAEVPLHDLAWTSVRPAGLLPFLDKRQTLRAALRRQLRAGGSTVALRREDLRFRTPAEGRNETSALLVAVLDVSASMGEIERRLARTLFFWTKRFLVLCYPHVEIRYVVHHTDAYEVSADQFFAVQEDGGTRCSAAYAQVLELVRSWPGGSNVYVLHVTDGDNQPGDMDRAVELARQLADVSNLFGYVEINPVRPPSELLTRLTNSMNSSSRSYQVRSARDVYPALCRLFSDSKERTGAVG